MVKRLILTCFSLLLLPFLFAACAKPALQPGSIEFGKSNLPEHWLLKGRIGVQSPNRSWQAAIHWNQQGEDFKFSLHSVFGRVLGRVEKRGKDVLFVDGDGHSQHRSANKLDHLVSQQVGMPVPISSLRYWVLGQPRPGQPWQRLGSLQENVQGFLQAGWSIRFNRWSLFKGQMLPSRLTLQHGEIKLRFVLHEWVMAHAPY